MSHPREPVGGAHPLHPGEVSLAHLGMLFLDELPLYLSTVRRLAEVRLDMDR